MTLAQFYADKAGEPVSNVQLFWRRPPGAASNCYDARYHWEMEPKFTHYTVIATGSWEIWVAYTLGAGDGGGSGAGPKYPPGVNYDCLL